MRVVLQRVKEASVIADGEPAGRIGRGLLILLGITAEDGPEDIERLTSKIVSLRIFSDGAGLMNLALGDIGGELLVVSQFTLYASTRKGNRPSYIRAARPEVAEPLYRSFVADLANLIAKPVQVGVFGADMQVSLVNDGPVTIILDTKDRDL